MAAIYRYLHDRDDDDPQPYRGIAMHVYWTAGQWKRMRARYEKWRPIIEGQKTENARGLVEMFCEQDVGEAFPCTASEIETVRRACNRLASEGMVEIVPLDVSCLPVLSDSYDEDDLERSYPRLRAKYYKVGVRACLAFPPNDWTRRLTSRAFAT